MNILYSPMINWSQKKITGLTDCIILELQCWVWATKVRKITFPARVFDSSLLLPLVRGTLVSYSWTSSIYPWVKLCTCIWKLGVEQGEKLKGRKWVVRFVQDFVLREWGVQVMIGYLERNICVLVRGRGFEHVSIYCTYLGDHVYI